jgi:hypothetical protein
MPLALSSYALARLDAVPVDVVVDSDRVKLVEQKTGRCVLWVGQPGSVVGTPSEGSGIQVPLRNLAPERINARKVNLLRLVSLDYPFHEIDRRNYQTMMQSA